jgi:peptidyl-prolyl cis-trans isomerase SurA
MNLTATNEEVDAKLAEMKAPVTEEQFEQHMKAENLTLDDLKHDIRRSLTGNKLLNKEINSKITVTDADVSSYYNQHKAEYNLIEPQYRLAQIQVTSVPSDQAGNLQGSKATNDAEAKKKIQALKTRLDSGEDFGTLAMNFSERVETASSGGDMGFVTESQLHADPMIYTEITRLKPGQITGIMPLLDAQTKKVMGYSIYKLVSKEPAGQRDLSDPIVQQAIRQQLQNDRSQLLKNAYFEMLRDQAKIVNYFAENLFKNATK